MVLGVTDKSRVGHVRWSGSRALPVHKPWAEPIGYFGWCRPVARGPSIDLLAWNFSLNVGGATRHGTFGKRLSGHQTEHHRKLLPWRKTTATAEVRRSGADEAKAPKNFEDFPSH